jgi:pimeloyl-ACP methyl ester carboxylesterase
VADLILLHGGGFGPWSWDLVRPGLEALGHPTTAVALSLDDTGLDANAALAEAQARARPDPGDPVVVIAHALGCAVLPLAAARLDAALMIWVCGVVPAPGTSCAALIAADATMIPMWQERPDRAPAPPGDEFERRAADLFPDAETDVRSWAIAQMRSQGPAVRAEPNAISDEFPPDGWPQIPAVSIVASDDRALAPAWSRAAARRIGAELVEIPGGHTPLLSRPDELAKLLGALLRRFEA